MQQGELRFLPREEYLGLAPVLGGRGYSGSHGHV